MRLGRILKALVTIGLAAILWLGIGRRVSFDPPADMSGHWEGPTGGLWFDASAAHFQLDIMHTFFYGRWTATGPKSCDLQFYDLSGADPVIDSPAMRGSAVLKSEGTKREVEVKMPDNTSVIFSYVGPPTNDMKMLDKNLGELSADPIKVSE